MHWHQARLSGCTAAARMAHADARRVADALAELPWRDALRTIP
ncbi:hypothetical protein [Streptomyces sp. NPDC096013]